MPFTQGGRLKSLGIFADDAYQLGRATINLGVRYDNSKAYFVAQNLLDANGNPTGAQSKAVDDVFNWRVVSPRLGVNFKLNESGSTLLKAHYGRYYRGIVTGEFDNTTPSITPRYVFSGLYNAAGVPLDKDLVSDTSQLSVDPNLRNPYTDQVILAFEQQAGPSVGLAVSYVYKRSEQQTAFPDIGGTYQLVPVHCSVRCDRAPGVPTDQRRRFTAVPAQERRPHVRALPRHGARHQEAHVEPLAGQLRPDAVEVHRTPGLEFRAFHAAHESSSTASIFGQNPNDYINSDGRLVGDRPMVLKTQFIYQWRWGIMTSFNFQSQSGKPIYSEIRATTSATGIPGATRIIAAASDGQDRTKLWQTLDARVEKNVQARKGPRRWRRSATS